MSYEHMWALSEKERAHYIERAQRGEGEPFSTAFDTVYFQRPRQYPVRVEKCNGVWYAEVVAWVGL
ncbi:hypothetical protein [Burkholderia phage BCSR5]|nr:hypothetical protein [Burkholderia phage BCSR5]